VKVQQFVTAHLGIKLPLLNGTFALVPTAQLAASNSNDGSSLPAAAMATAIPWRLRQVSAVEVAPGGDPADATVVLVGGDRVRAGAVRQGSLTDSQEHEVRIATTGAAAGAALWHQTRSQHSPA
jgi:hypothetical protein